MEYFTIVESETYQICVQFIHDINIVKNDVKISNMPHEQLENS